jgi:hypothetical protein
VKTFKDFSLEESRGYPTWVKGTTIVLMTQVRSLSHRIENEKRLGKKIDLMSRQNNLISYMITLGIGVNTNDPTLLSRVKKGSSK